jgi:flagellar biogenesis protein FliO
MVIAPIHQRENRIEPMRHDRFGVALMVVLAITILAAASLSAQPVISTNAPSTADLPSSTSVVFSLVRVLGALGLVFAVFFGGLWVFRNWQRFTVRNGQPAKLNVIEVKSLGPRHALYVVGYEQQRILIASSPTGVSMLTNLPASELDAAEAATVPRPTFAESLRQALHRKS